MAWDTYQNIWLITPPLPCQKNHRMNTKLFWQLYFFWKFELSSNQVPYWKQILCLGCSSTGLHTISHKLHQPIYFDLFLRQQNKIDIPLIIRAREKPFIMSTRYHMEIAVVVDTYMCVNTTIKHL